MAARITSTCANNMIDELQTLLDAGSAGAKIKFYDGTRPAGPGTAVTTQTLVATLTASDPCGTTAGGVLTFGTITDDTNCNGSSNPVTWARLTDSDNNAVIDLSVGTSGEDINLSNTEIGSGDTLSMSSLTITMPTS